MNPDPGGGTTGGNTNEPLTTVPTTGPAYTVSNGVDADFACTNLADLVSAITHYREIHCKGCLIIQWDDCPEQVEELPPTPAFGGLGRGGGVRLTTGLR